MFFFFQPKDLFLDQVDEVVLVILDCFLISLQIRCGNGCFAFSQRENILLSKMFEAIIQQGL